MHETRVCPAVRQTEHLKIRFSLPSPSVRILRIFGLPGGRRVTGGRNSLSLEEFSVESDNSAELNHGVVSLTEIMNLETISK